MDLAVGFVKSTNLNYRMRVLESLVLRIYRPRAICTFEPRAGAGEGVAPAPATRRRRAGGRVTPGSRRPIA